MAEAIEKPQDDRVECGKCGALLGRLEQGKVEIFCRRCKTLCRAVVVMAPKIVVEIITPSDDNAPAPAL